MKIPFHIDRTLIGARYDAAYVTSSEDPIDALALQIVDSISTELEVKVGDVTMHLAGWQAPDHWAEDWAAALHCDLDEVDEAIGVLIASVADTTT